MPVLALTARCCAAALAAAAGLAGCGAPEEEGGETPVAGVQAPRPLVGTLAWSVAGEWRPAEERRRDGARKPVETLEFFRVAPGDVVVEAWPGSGWYAAVIAPYLAAGGGAYIAAHPAPTSLDARLTESERAFFERFGDARLYGQVRQGQLGPDTGPIAAEGSVDRALAFRVVHAWMSLGLAEKAFADMHAALKPGGYLGVVEARAPERGVQDPRAPTGYVQQSYVRLLAEEAGFVLVEASDLHANSADDADHPFGVWTLPPYRRSAPLGEPPAPAFDHAPFDAVGEPDRMTLLFRKPRG
ncbi:MAG: methyltransferase [Caulobacterales bacterium]|nr:methyltransferase [Caulobacterales bacterium]